MVPGSDKRMARLAGGKPGRLRRMPVGGYCWVRVTGGVAGPL